jgi:hypothetical protein
MDGRPPKRPRLLQDVDLQAALHTGRISMAGLRTKATTSCVQWVLLCNTCMIIERCPASLHQQSNCFQVFPKCSPMLYSALQMLFSVLQELSKCSPMFSKCSPNVPQLFSKCYRYVRTMLNTTAGVHVGRGSLQIANDARHSFDSNRVSIHIVSGHCGPLYVSGHCGPLHVSGHCGPLHVSGHCGPLYVSGHCGPL